MPISIASSWLALNNLHSYTKVVTVNTPHVRLSYLTSFTLTLAQRFM